MRITTLVAALALAGGALAQNKEPPPEKTGVKAGEKAPEFTLKDQNGKERTLAEFLKKGKVALVFYRSASW
jgi:cytochrome oxidase Cu insertion factor (SCO1/SenC/PrrC family)